jgi:hypothetical protein
MRLTGDFGYCQGSGAFPTLPWDSFQASVKRLQMRIAKAIRVNLDKTLMTGWPGSRDAFEGLEPYEGKLFLGGCERATAPPYPVLRRE